MLNSGKDTDIARFPIQYSEKLPPVVGPAVRAGTLPSTGAEEIGEAISGLSGTLLDIHKKIENTNKVLDLAKGRRQRDMAINDTMAVLEMPLFDPNNDELVQEIRQKTEAKMQEYKSKYAEVNTTLTAEFDQNYARLDEAFKGKILKLKAAKAKDEKTALETSYYETGALLPFASLQYSLVATGEQGQQEADTKIYNFLKESALLRASIDIRKGNLISPTISVLTDKEFLNTLSAEQLKTANQLQAMARQQAAINTDQIQNEIVFGMFENRNKTLAERALLGPQYLNKLRTTPGLSAEDARVMTNRIEDWMQGKARTNNSLVSSRLFTKITQLHRGIGKAEEIKRETVANFDNLDDGNFESLNKYIDETVEEWNADTLRRLEREAIPHLAPRLSMLEKFIEMAATPGISVEQKTKYDTLIERLTEPAKVDADRLSLYLNQCRKWIAANPTAPNLFEVGKGFRSTFERYTDEQIRQMEKQLESEPIGGQTPDQFGFVIGESRTVEGKNYKYIGNDQWQQF